MTAFFSFNEFIAMYKGIFDPSMSDLLEDAGQPSTKTVAKLSGVLNYFDSLLACRNSRKIPLSVEVTMNILRYYVNSQRLVLSVTDVSAIKELSTSNLYACATRIFKGINQIVDLSQKGKHAMSFQHILKKLGFEHSGTIAHVRNAYFHQEMPADISIKTAISNILQDLKRLYWDMNYAWFINFTEDDNRTAIQACNLYGAAPLSKAEVNDVDEYSDMCLVLKELRVYLAEQEHRKFAKENVAGFIKNRVKGLHRKQAVAALVSREAETITREQLVSISPLPVARLNRLEQLLGILQHLLDIFQSNVNMHDALLSSPLKETVASLVVILKTIGLLPQAVAGLEKLSLKPGADFFSLAVELTDGVLGKRYPTEKEDDQEDILTVDTDPTGSEIKYHKLEIGKNFMTFMESNPENKYTKVIQSMQDVKLSAFN